MPRIFFSVLVTGLAYGLFLGSRTDYLGHYLAGFGGTLLLLAVPLTMRKRTAGWIVPGLVVLAIIFGILTEATLFRIAIFDPVDFCNQSLGAVLAGACFMGNPDPAPSLLAITATAILLLCAGFFFAFA